MSLGAAYCVYNACPFLAESVERIYPVVDKIIFLINFKPWCGEPFPAIPGTVASILDIPDKDKKFEVVIGYWENEAVQRNVGLKILRENTIDWCFIIDDDELFNEGELRNIKAMLEGDAQHAAYLVNHQIYWKDTKTIIEGFVMALPAFARTDGTVYFNKNRMILVNKEHTWFTISAGSIVCHHMSYVRTDEEMERKISSFSHADEIYPDWYQRVWLGNVSTNLHPTNESEFKRAIPVSESKYQLDLMND